MLRSGERQRAGIRSRIHSLALAATTSLCFLAWRAKPDRLYRADIIPRSLAAMNDSMR